MHIGMLTDYVAVDATFGPALATQHFRRNMEHRGHDITFIGPRPATSLRQAPPDSILFDSVTFPAYHGVRLPFPSPREAIYDIPKFDVIHAHSNSLMMHWAPMMRDVHGIPALSTNTFYLPGFIHNVIPEKLLHFGPVVPTLDHLTKLVEQSFARVYNAGDGLIVQCQGLIDYWQSVGMIDVPIHVINRPIDVRNFNRTLGPDPYRPDFRKGARLLAICRHAKEKALDKLLSVFAHYILPNRPEASLTLVGDGPHHVELQRVAETLGVGHRVDFVGERPQRDLPEYYAYGDLFTYTSMIETFGQVVSEALWMGMPVVGKDDKMGVAHQVRHGETGMLVQPGKNEEAEFGAVVRELLDNTARRREMAVAAATRQRTTSAPEVVYAQYEAAYASAQEHYKTKPSQWLGRRDAAMKWWLAKTHTFPWFWKHSLLLAMGAIPNHYKPKNKVPFDAAPEEPADELYAHVPGAKSPLPQHLLADDDTEKPTSEQSAEQPNARPEIRKPRPTKRTKKKSA